MAKTLTTNAALLEAKAKAYDLIRIVENARHGVRQMEAGLVAQNRIVANLEAIEEKQKSP